MKKGNLSMFALLMACILTLSACNQSPQSSSSESPSSSEISSEHPSSSEEPLTPSSEEPSVPSSSEVPPSEPSSSEIPSSSEPSSEEPSEELPNTKTISMNDASFSTTDAITYVIKEEDTAYNISRISVLFIANFNDNWNNNSKQYYQLSVTAGSNMIETNNDFYSQSVDDANGNVIGEKGLVNLEINPGEKLNTGDTISVKTWYCADGLTFNLSEISLYYSEWKDIEQETITINKPLWQDGQDVAEIVSLNYSNFTKKGRVNKMELNFSSINELSWAKSQIHITGFQFTDFPTGNNDVLNISSIMDTSSSGKQVSGSMFIYPIRDIDLTNNINIEIDCWWASGSLIILESITMHTESMSIPEPVKNLKAHGVNNAVTLSWSASKNATDYEIYLNDELNQTVKTNSATVVGLENDTTYKFGVVAKNSMGKADMVIINGTPSISGDYDQFIDGLNTGLEEYLDYQRVNTILNSSIVSLSNNERYIKAIEKMKNGQETTVAYIGGSITVGETSLLKDEKNHCKGYAYYSYQWLKSKYDVANKSTFHNAAISGTGSEVGIVRAQKDIIDHNPDIIFMEYAVNNGSTLFHRSSYESMIRTFLSLPNSPAVILVFSAAYYWTTTQNYMEPMGDYYDIPMFSFRDGLQQICNTSLGKEDPIFSLYTDDGLHPNDQGHQLMGKALAYFLRELEEKGKDKSYTMPSTPSEPNFDKFVGLTPVDHNLNDECITSLGSFVEADTSTYCTKDAADVTAFRQGWQKQDGTNDALTIEVDAKNFVLVYCASNPVNTKGFKGNIIVTYTNNNNPSDTGQLTWDINKSVKQDNYDNLEITRAEENGWDNPVSVLIFDKDISASYTITIKMSASDERCSIMAFGYTK